MYNEKHIVVRSIPRYTKNLLIDSTQKIRKMIANHKEGIITTAILGTTAAIVTVSVRSLEAKVNS
jgi:thiamine phosphate synthase YjbQ (UPF0047 family)